MRALVFFNKLEKCRGISRTLSAEDDDVMRRLTASRWSRGEDALVPTECISGLVEIAGDV